jgi:hypothetical protein
MIMGWSLSVDHYKLQWFWLQLGAPWGLKMHQIQMILLFKTIDNVNDIHHLYFPSIQSFIYVKIMPLVINKLFNCCVL